MKAILVYLNLVVIYVISCNMASLDEKYKITRLVGAMFGLWALIFAFIYALYSMYMLFLA